MKYSVIIATYKRPATLALTLKSLAGQTIPPADFEVIVVDDGSGDETEKVVMDFARENQKLTVRYFKQEHGGVAKARNRGIKEARGKIIFFTDDDCVVPDSWIETLADGYKRYPDAVGVGGWYRPATPALAKRYFQRHLTFIEQINAPRFLDNEINTNNFYANSAGNTSNMSYKKEILDKLGGFDEKLYFVGSVDWELKARIQMNGYCLLYLPFKVDHLKDLTLRTFLKKAFNQGRGRYYLTLKYPVLSRSTELNHTIFNTFRGIVRYILECEQFWLAHALSEVTMMIGQKWAAAFRLFGKIEPAPLKILRPHTSEIIKKDVTNGRVMITRYTTALNGSENSVKISVPPNILYSVVIPTYNRCGALVRAVESVANQSIDPASYEIIIVDDGSSDNTRRAILDTQKKYGQRAIRYFYQKNSGPAAARNRGIKEARGDIVFFTDDDCLVPKDWMEKLLGGLQRYPEAVGVGGWHVPPEGEIAVNRTSRYAYAKNFSDPIFMSYEILSNDPLTCLGTFAANTANVCYKKKVLEEVGGFKESFHWPGYEDMDLSFRIMSTGYPLLYLPYHVVQSRALRLSDFMRLSFRRAANGHLFRKFNRDVLEKLRPGYADQYSSLSHFFNVFWLTKNYLAFIEWAGEMLGIHYSKWRGGA